ncbi:MAG: hypothetical protein K2I23_04065, partial [Clostridia bacterium]|nr:hypothetical protein [Clostridia bacterium]
IIDVYIDISQSTIIHTGKTMPITVEANAQGLPPVTINQGNIVLDEYSRQIPVKLDFSNLIGDTSYTLSVKTTSGSYLPNLTSRTTLAISPAPLRKVITWNVYNNDLLMRGHFEDADISQSQTNVTLSGHLPYNGKRYSFKVSLPTGYRLDTGYGVNGILVTPSTSDNNNVGINADSYTTSIRLIENSSGYNQEYAIQWTIDPVKFDLGGVKWLYDDGSALQLPYDKVNGSKATLDPKTLPNGLEPIYPTTNEGTTVGTSGTATVTFALASGYEGNYILPDEEDVTSYIDPSGAFKWNIPWNIVKAEIISTSWKNVTATDANGKAFSVPVLRDPNADGGIVEYEYYETDSTGNVLDANKPLKESDIVWSESESKFYIAKPVLQDTQNYELDDITAQSKVFRVGKDLTKVSVSLESTTMEYNTNPRHAKLVVANGALPTTAFDLTYYDGYTKLSTAPSEVGKYRVEVSLKNTYIDKYEIDGDYEFDYEIVKAQIPVEWNDNAKPSVLKLTYGQINGIEYEIVDADDNAVAYNALQAGKPYRIRAKIKDNQLGNFIFADGTVETAWHEFSVTANDIANLKDPNSPSNPAYPQTDPDLPNNPDDTTPSGNDPSSGEEGGSGSLGDILEKLKDIPLWQLIASVISIILIIVFLSKTAGYESKRKKFNKKTDKLDKVYAVAFLGLPMAGWTAIACVLMALAVVSLVIMLIAKSRCNKAEEEYEDRLDEYNRNKKDEDKENMRMMLMGMMGGQGNNGGMAQGAYMGGGYGMGIDDMRGLISEAVSAL